MPEMMTPRTCLGYDVVVASFPTHALVVNRGFLLIVGGSQTEFSSQELY
jgi:hypothetical protein